MKMRNSTFLVGMILIGFFKFLGCSSTETTLNPKLSEKPVVPSVKIVLLDERVSANIPRRWTLMQETSLKQLYSIPFPEAENTQHSANASIATDRINISLNVQDYGNSILADSIIPSEGSVIVSDNQDGKYWRSVLWRAQDQVPYVVWDRFGVKDGVVVHFRVGYPLLENSIESQKILTEEINAVTESLTIHGK